MNVFGSYSKYYNLLYRDKDYAGEARYVHSLIQRHRAGAASILDLGCGTGRHAFELARFGYAVTGIDRSHEMLFEAQQKQSALQEVYGTNITLPEFCQGDVRAIRIDGKFDVITALFHVMSYQTSNQDLRAVFATARAHLVSGGLFLFDCWYGPAVLSDPPVTRVKRLHDDEIEVLRIAEPEHRPAENLVDVNYQVLITDKATGRVDELRETHRMRYLFSPEVAEFFSDNGMQPLTAEEWLTARPPGTDTWGVCFVGAAI